MSTNRLGWDRGRLPLAVFALLAGVSLGIYLLASARLLRLGFPLDDSWIHQTYARNLALRGEWSFIPGEPSAGSTAPLWSLLVSAGYLLRLGPYFWTYGLGWLFLAALALLGAAAFPRMGGPAGRWPLAAGVFLALEWHLVWAAGSGMETLLVAALVLAFFLLLFSGWRGWLGLGMLAGLAAWVRPDGLTLLGPGLLLAFARETGSRNRLLAAARLLLGLALPFAPYLLFNRLLAGAWWPNTFYAKQAEYAVLLQSPLWHRYIAQVIPLLQGAGAVLLPGVLYFWWDGLRHRDWAVLAGAAWFLGYLGLYALRLPVAYQHGRYLLPVLPLGVVWGLVGMARLVQGEAPGMLRRVFGKAWAASAGLVLLLYWGMGAGAYASDVAVIETEMVATARWVAENTDPQALVAAHDIGALGFFGQRKLLDLAGLVSPEVIPFIRDETRLAAFLDQRQADYLIAFPNWYPQLDQIASPVFSSGGKYAPQAGGENMVVYRWRYWVSGAGSGRLSSSPCRCAGLRRRCLPILLKCSLAEVYERSPLRVA